MEEKNLKLQAAVKRYVNSIRRWNKFFAIVSIVSMSLFTLMGIMMILLSVLGFDDTMSEAMAESGMPFAAWILGAIYIVSAGLMLPAVIYLMRAAKAARTAVALNNNEAAMAFMRNTKSYWKYYGILTIVVLGLCVLVIPAAFVVGMLTVL